MLQLNVNEYKEDTCTLEVIDLCIRSFTILVSCDNSGLASAVWVKLHERE